MRRVTDNLKGVLAEPTGVPRLEIAAGEDPAKPDREDITWWHHDVRALPHIEIVCDWRRLDRFVHWFFELYSKHFIEHLTIEEGLEFLRLCWKITHPGGLVTIVTPNLKWLCERYVSGAYIDSEEMNYYLFGRQQAWWNFHKSLYDCDLLCRNLRQVGFEIVRHEELDGGFSICVVAQKPSYSLAEGAQP